MIKVNTNIFIPDDFTIEEVQFIGKHIEDLIQKNPGLNKLYFYVFHINTGIRIRGYNKKKINKVCKDIGIRPVEYFLKILLIEGINSN